MEQIKNYSGNYKSCSNPKNQQISFYLKLCHVISFKFTNAVDKLGDPFCSTFGFIENISKLIKILQPFSTYFNKTYQEAFSLQILFKKLPQNRLFF